MARVRKGRGAYRVFEGKPHGKATWKDLGVSGRILCKFIFKE
jgi:hypothetical protein